MSDSNPFAVGEYADAEFGSGSSDPNQHPQMNELLTLLSQTRPWVRFISILMIIGAALMLLGGMFMIVGAVMGGAADGGQMIVMGAIYLPMAFLYVYPALCLSRYASAIRTAERSTDMTHVVAAISHQKKFWMFCGIIAAVILAIYALIFVFAFVVAVAGMI
jgi:hypothetical protein